MSECEMFLCPRCGKVRAKHNNKSGYCQCCYREMLDAYSFYDYKDNKKKLKGNTKKICELLIEEGKDRTEIHKILGLNKSYVQQVIKKNTIKVDRDGHKRPF